MSSATENQHATKLIDAKRKFRGAYDSKNHFTFVH